MGRLKNKTIIFGSSGDIGKKIKQVLNNHYLLEINSKELDLSDIEAAKKFDVKILPDNIIFVSGKNNPKEYVKLSDEEIIEIFNINFISFIIVLKKILKKIIKSKKKCKIILITSLYSQFGRSKRLLYSISKHALRK